MPWRWVSIGLACLLLIGLGAAGGAGLASWHYRPPLDQARQELTACRAARGNLETLAAEQGRQVAALRLADKQRAEAAAQALAQARQQAQGDYAAAQRLLRERTAGDQCGAAEAVIDRELGL